MNNQGKSFVYNRGTRQMSFYVDCSIFGGGDVESRRDISSLRFPHELGQLLLCLCCGHLDERWAFREGDLRSYLKL